MSLRVKVKEMIYRLGWEVRRAYPLPRSGRVPSFTDAFHEQRRLLANVECPTIFDVGAHVGRTVVKYRELFPQSLIYAFEPFKSSYEELKAVANSLPQVFSFNIALGDVAGEVTLNVNRSTATNSLLATDARAKETWNGSDVTETVQSARVSVETLDAFIERNPLVRRIDVLKLDAQGSEMKILSGAENALRAGRVRMVYMEIIVRPTYIGQTLWTDYFEWLREVGFDLHNVYSLCHSNDGQLNQLDALFVWRGDT
jgi:FkbM family methyltransferase